MIDRDGEPWFVAKDVCEALEFQVLKQGTGPFIAHLDSDEKTSIGSAYAHGMHPQTSLINESGLYSLILKSRKPEAKAFKKWVTSEVLPTIRKTGGYMVPSLAKQAVEDPTP